MNTKSLLLGTIVLVGAATDASARVTGFYVGAGASVSASRVKLIDQSSHAGTTLTVQAKVGCGYVGGVGVDILPENTNNPVAVPVQVRGVLSGEHTSKPIYLPSVGVHVGAGYDIQVGRNFFIGIEARGDVTVAYAKNETSIQVPDLVEYHTNATTHAVEVHSTATTFKNQGAPCRISVNDIFTGTIVMKAGVIVPGSDGRMSVYILGGGGVSRAKLDVSVSGVGNRMMRAVLDSAIHGAKEKWYADQNSGAMTADSRVSSSNLYDLIYFCQKFQSIEPYNLLKGNVTSDTTMTTYVTDLDALARRMVINLLRNASTKSGQLLPALAGVIPDPDLSAKKWVGVAVFGSGIQYALSGGLFVRLEGRVSRRWPVVASKNVPVSFDALSAALGNVVALTKDGTLNKYFSNVQSFSHIFAPDANTQNHVSTFFSTLTTATMPFSNYLTNPNVNLGDVVQKYSTGPLWNMSVSVSVGYKF
ncbi:MAG: hypothetical protein LBR89_04495 [Holosporales bacterium]|jgi:hypothetical protein|nr:hypothetical protein [Holosporales bacterium]